MINNKSKDLNPKVFKTILIWALVTYTIQIIATITGQILRGAIDWQYQVVGWLTSLAVPAIALLIGLIISKLRHQQNRLYFATIFAVSTYLLYLIFQILLSYGNVVFWKLDTLGYSIAPILVALIFQTLISILLTKQPNGAQSSSTRWFVIALSLGVVMTQAIQSIQIIPSMINFANVANSTHTIVLPVVLWLMLVIPVALLAILIVANSFVLYAVKNISQRLFLGFLAAVFAFVVVSSLLSFSGIEPLHNVSNLWICAISYLLGLSVDGVIIHRLRRQMA